MESRKEKQEATLKNEDNRTKQTNRIRLMELMGGRGKKVQSAAVGLDSFYKIKA